MTHEIHFAHTAPTELHITDPKNMPDKETVKAIIESCLTLPDEAALAASLDYRKNNWDDVISFLPDGLDTEESFRESLERFTELLHDSLTTNVDVIKQALEANPPLVIGSYAIRGTGTSSDISRGVGLWAPATELSQ